MGALDTSQVLPWGSVDSASFGGGILTLMSNPSDSRLKHERSSYGYGLAEIKQLTPEYFKYNKTAYDASGLHTQEDSYYTQENIGIMADDLEDVMPKLVDNIGDTDYKSYNKDALIFTLINAVKELEARIVTLEAA